MKKKDIIMMLIIIILIVLIITGGITIIKLKNELKNGQENKISNKSNTITEVTSGAVKFKYEYENLNGTKTPSGETYNTLNIDLDNSIKYVTLNELVNIIDNEDAYIYISSPSCPYCRATVETLLQITKELNIDTLYYFDAFKENSEENYDELMTKLQEKEIVRVNDEGKKTWGIPILLKTKDGQVVSKVRGVSYQLNDGQSRYDSLTDEQKKEVYDRYYEALTME